MSSDQNTPIITMNNYEEMFLLYVDGELTPDQMNQVDAFVATHPFLQVELDQLLETKLSAEPGAFDFSGLMSEDMKKYSAQEDLLLYLDNELDADRSNKLLHTLAGDANLREHFTVLKQTKLDSTELIPYPNKQELLRSEKRKGLIPVWMQMAAAAAVVIAVGIKIFNSKPTKETADPAETLAINPGKLNPAATTKDNDQMAVITPSNASQTDAVAQPGIISKSQAAIKSRKTQKQPNPVATPAPDQQDDYQDQNYYPTTESPMAPALRNVAMSGSQLGNLPAVAAAAVLPSKISSLSVTLPVQARNTDVASTKTDDTPIKTSVKGFLRKATKLIEKTGIDPVNDDGELLIGAIAVKVK